MVGGSVTVNGGIISPGGIMKALFGWWASGEPAMGDRYNNSQCYYCTVINVAKHLYGKLKV